MELDQSCLRSLLPIEEPKNHSQQMGNGRLEMNTKYEFSSLKQQPQLIHNGLFYYSNSSSDQSFLPGPTGLSSLTEWGWWVTWSYHSRLVQVHSGHHPPCPLELLPFTLGPPLDWPFGFGPPGPPPDMILPLLLPKVPPPPPMLPPPPEAGGGKVWPPPYPGGYP